jgi:hypothetical protein
MANLLDKPQQAGLHTIVWEPKRFSSGVYILRVASADQTVSTKLTLVH